MGTKVDILKSLVASKGLNYVGGKGNPQSPIWIAGEAPGADEDACGLPFMGHAGKQLDGQIAEVGLPISQLYFTNPYKVRPPGNDIDQRYVLGIPDEVYREAFFEELHENRPTFIVAAGATPLSILCPFTCSRKDNSPRISAWRGSLLSSPFLGWPHYVIPMYHPAFILRDYSERTICTFCLDRVKEEFEWWRGPGGGVKLQPLLQRELIDDPSADDIVTYLMDCLQAPPSTKISVDLENPFYKRIQIPYVINLSLGPRSAISFNLWDLPPNILASIWRLVARVLAERQIIGQNYINFDIRLLEETVGLRTNLVGLDDTMTRHKVLWPEFEHALQFQTIQYTREPYYKDEGHDWDTIARTLSGAAGKRALRTYGAKDAAVTYEVWQAQEAELDSRGLREFYERIEMPLARNLHVVSQRGIQVDTAKLAGLRQKVVAKLIEICKDAEKFIGRPVFFDGDSAKEYQREAKAFVKGASPKAKIKQSDIPVFNLGSPKQILDEFQRLNIWLPYNQTTGGRSTDEEAMQKSFAKTGHQLPKMILESRGLNKLKGTNLDANLREGILYTNYISTGTVNGRRSSSMLWDDTPFVYGANTQNLPKHGKGIIGDFQKEFRSCLVARPGYIFLAGDQVQAEDWIVQGIIKDQGGSPQGFEELLLGIDRHRKLASHIFRKAEAECGKDSHERYLGKKTRHAGNYDMGAFRFAVVLAKEGYHITEKDCQSYLDAFHAFDPGIRGVFHKYIQQTLENTRTLVNPFGRIRIFFGLHPYRDNTKVFKEAYSVLPQSTVSDNTGQAINYIESYNQSVTPPLQFPILKDDHDALTLEIPDNTSAIVDGILLMREAFNRTIRLEKGLEFRIPIEFEIGYKLAPYKSKSSDGNIKIIQGGMEGLKIGDLNEVEQVRDKIKGQVCHV